MINVLPEVVVVVVVVVAAAAVVVGKFMQSGMGRGFIKPSSDLIPVQI